MRFDLVTIFPGAVRPLLDIGVLGRARDRGDVELRVHDLRDFASPPHRKVDDEVYGGGAGMAFQAEPILRAVNTLRPSSGPAATILMTPSGEPLDQGLAAELSEYHQLTVLCDRYEGSDERVRTLVTHELSVGDFVLTGGELAALTLVDVVARLGAGVIGKPESVGEDSFQDGWLDYPCYTRPERWQGHAVPEVLLSGNHAAIASWRRQSAVRRTLERRPDLIGWMAGQTERVAQERRRTVGAATNNRIS